MAKSFLDKSLLRTEKNFSLDVYCKAVEHELKSFGFSVHVEKKEKKVESDIDSAFIKAGTLKNMITIDIPESVRKRIHTQKLMKIKFEVDTKPPGGFNTEAKYLFQPIPFFVNTYSLPDLFAGKMHAVLCRAWGKRVKGRDWYDLVWHVGRETPVHLKHLGNRMKQTGHLDKSVKLTENILKEKIVKRIETTDFNNAKKDVKNFIKDPTSLQLWSKEFFIAVCEKVRCV